MNCTKKVLFAITALLASLATLSPASAQGKVTFECVIDNPPPRLSSFSSLGRYADTGRQSGNFSVLENSFDQEQLILAYFDYMPMCKDRDEWAFYLRGTAFALEIATIAAACSGVGAPAIAYIQTAGILVNAAQIYVEELPCQDKPEPTQKEIIKEAVCEELQKNNIDCDPSALEINNERRT